jgi:hypothetical protein
MHWKLDNHKDKLLALCLCCVECVRYMCAGDASEKKDIAGVKIRGSPVSETTVLTNGSPSDNLIFSATKDTFEAGPLRFRQDYHTILFDAGSPSDDSNISVKLHPWHCCVCQELVVVLPSKEPRCRSTWPSCWSSASRMSGTRTPARPSSATPKKLPKTRTGSIPLIRSRSFMRAITAQPYIFLSILLCGCCGSLRCKRNTINRFCPQYKDSKNCVLAK